MHRKYADKKRTNQTDNVEIWGQIGVQRQCWTMRTNGCTQTKFKYEDKLLYRDKVEIWGQIAVHRQCWRMWKNYTDSVDIKGQFF